MVVAPLAGSWRYWLVGLALAGPFALLAGQLHWPAAAVFDLLLAAIVVGLGLHLRGQANSVLQPAWDALAIGLGIWLGSDLLRAALEGVGGGPIATPSLLDLLRLVGYGLVAVGLWRYPAPARAGAVQLRVLLDLILTVGAATAIAYDISLRPLLLSVSPQTAAGLVWQMVDPAAALMITIAALVAVLRAPVISLRLSLLLVAAGCAVAVDLNRTVGQAAIGLGAIVAGAWPGRDLPAGGGRQARLLQILQRSLPVAAVLALFVETIAVQAVLGQTNAAGMYLAILFSALLIVRQGVLLGEAELQRHAQLVDSTADAAFVCREDGQLLLANPAAYDLLGLKPDASLRGCTLHHLFEPAPPATVAEILAQGRRDGWHGEGSAFYRGRPVTLSLTLNALRDEAGAVTGLAGIARDMTERQHMESKLRSLNAQLLEAQDRLLRLNAELERKVAERTANLAEANRRLEAQNAQLQSLDQMKSEFVSLVSHELRTPLTNLNGGLELLLSRDEGMSLDTREALVLMSRAARHLTTMVETILDLSALEAGQLPIDLRSVSLSKLVPSVVEEYRAIAEAVRVAVDLPAGLPPALADERGLRSAVYQLLDNAVKYAPGSPVEISARRTNGIIELQVVDHGPGIASAEHEKVFEKFHRLNSSDSQQVYGHGLGLHTTRRFIEAMGGKIALSTTPGGGATFRIALQESRS